ncbi:MAG: PBP1A family penicillin-binding protein [Oligoflexia bacterium]|nr:PBP1A family penicillin-binding protein [Oligoflexia bacterium]
MLKKIFILAVLGALGFGAGYLYVDRMVAARLSSRRDQLMPAVYSDTQTLASGHAIKAAVLKNALLDRRYREVTGAPANPGEFSVRGATFEIYTPAFRTPDGRMTEPLRAAFDTESATVSNHTHPESNLIVLEPQIVSYLGNAEQRASSFRPLKEIPDNIIKAVVAIEDERFVRHAGIDLIGISRAMVKNIAAMRVVEGGSTITQQLAKNLIFTPKRTLGRKVMEAFGALSLERRLSKDQILELYLNEVYLGQEGAVSIHGVAEAAKTFFGKQLEELTLCECAMLAGMIKAPSLLSPRKHFKRALERAALVLNKLRELNLISEKQLQSALLEKPQVIKETLHARTAPHYITALSTALEDSLNLEAASFSGLMVFTGLDPALQQCAEDALSKGVAKLESQNKALAKNGKRLEAGLVAIEPYSGKIKAWVGSRDYSENQFDHVYQAKRQIGSTVKAFLYLTALDRNLNSYKTATPLTILSDQPLAVDLVTKQLWEPENYDKKYRGDVTLRYALENSLNVPAAYVGQRVGIPNLVRTLKQFRVSDQPPAVPALALGAADTTLLQLTSGYAALANGGIYTAPRMFISALDSEGIPLAVGKIFEERVADENAVYVLTNILQGVIERGTGAVIRRLGFTGNAAGKTGTSNETRDAWFEGFTPNLATGVWVGLDDNLPIGLTGGVAAAPIWAEFMKCAAEYREDLAFVPPPGVVFLHVDSATGELATPACPSEQVVREVYVRGTEPQRACRLHGEGIEEAPPDYGSLPAAEQTDDTTARHRRENLWDTLFGR